jgi:uncharacterized membrane protein
MPDLGPFHPQIVHFAIGLAVAGVVFRLISLTGRAAFAGPAAGVLLLAGALAGAAATRSGLDAHGPVERVPGSRDAVVEHEEWGIRARNTFLVVAGLEILALILARRGRARPVLWVSAAAGLGGLFCLYEAGEHGGRLVYSYAGGVGLRTGERADVGRLLLAGLYHQAQLDRKEGRAAAAAALVETARQRFPDDLEVRLLAAESRLVDRKDAAGALEELGQASVPSDNRRLRLRHGLLSIDALLAAGKKEDARALLKSLQEAFPQDARLRGKGEGIEKAL